MEMQNVEMRRAAADLFQHCDVMGKEILNFRIELSATSQTGHQLGTCKRIAAGKKGHVMAQPYEFFGQAMDDSLRASVKLRRDAFCKGCDLRQFSSLNS